MQTPPILDGIPGQVGRIARGGHAHVPFVSLRIINAVRCRPALGILGEVVSIDWLRLLPPALTRILEAADEFLLLRVDADARIACLSKLLALLGDVAELLVAIRVRASRVQRFAMASQTEFLCAKQATYRRRTSSTLQLL